MMPDSSPAAAKLLGEESHLLGAGAIGGTHLVFGWGQIPTRYPRTLRMSKKTSEEQA
jgi:hypothetical protein